MPSTSVYAPGDSHVLGAPAPVEAAAPSAAPTAPAGNAATLEALGLPAGAPASALSEVVAVLEEEAAPLLDRLPLAVAAEVAWAARGSPWALAWLSALPVERLGREAAAVWRRLLDWFWPVGQAIELGGLVGAKAFAGGAGGAVFRLERDGEGVLVGARFSAEGTAGEGVGAEVGGAGGELLVGLGASLDLSAALAVDARWRLAGTVPAGTAVVSRFLSEPAALARALLADLAAAGTPPESWRADVRGDGGGGAAGGASALQGELSGSFGAGVAVGMERDRGFVELQFGGTLEGALAGNLVDALTACGELSGGVLATSLAAGLSLRAEGDPAALARGDFAEAEFVLGDRSTTGHTETADTLRTRDRRVAAAWLAERLTPGGAPFGDGETARPTPVAALPALTLVRTVRRPVLDLDQIDLVAPGFTSALADALPDHGLVVGLESAEIAGTVAVGPPAVAAAVGGAEVPVGASAEEAVLAIERRVAGALLGGAAPAPDQGLALDLAAGVAAAEVRELTLTGRAEAVMGGAAAVAAGGEVELRGELSLAVERTVELAGPDAAALLLREVDP